MSRSVVAAATAAVASLALTAAPSTTAAPDAAHTYVVPGRNVFPFGISALGRTYYVSSAGPDDTIYRGDLRERRARVFARGGRASTSTNGIEATATRLVVTENSGGPARVVVYTRGAGHPVATFTNGLVDSFLPMIAAAPNGDAYVTDAINPVLTGYRPPPWPGTGVVSSASASSVTCAGRRGTRSVTGSTRAASSPPPTAGSSSL